MLELIKLYFGICAFVAAIKAAGVAGRAVYGAYHETKPSLIALLLAWISFLMFFGQSFFILFFSFVVVPKLMFERLPKDH